MYKSAYWLDHHIAGHMPSNITAHGGLSPHTPITNQKKQNKKNLPHLPKGQSDGGIFSPKIRSSLVQVDKNLTSWDDLHMVTNLHGIHRTKLIFCIISFFSQDEGAFSYLR